MQDKPKDDIDLEQRIYHLERENKILKHKLQYCEKYDKIARKIVLMYEKLADEFKHEISDTSFDEWWDKPPYDISITLDTKQ